MDSALPIPPPPAIAKPRRRWLRGCATTFLSILVSAVLALVGAYYYYSHATAQAWAEAEAETDTLDPRWRLHDIEADREQIPDAENSALHIMSLTAKTGEFQVRNVHKYEFIFDGLSPTAELNEEQLRLIRVELAKIAKPLEEARRFKDMPRGRFPITYSEDFIGTLVPEQMKARGPGDWLQHDAMLLAHEKHYDLAVDSCRGIVNVGRAFGDEPFMISALIRMAMHGISTETLERVLGQGEASDEKLHAFQVLLVEEVNNTHFLQALRGERAGSVSLFECISDGRVTFDKLSAVHNKSSQSLSDRFVDTIVLGYFPDYLREMNRAVEAAKLPIHERHAPMQEWDFHIKGKKTNPVIRVLTPGLVKIHEADCRSQAMLRSTVAALACERHRLRHKEWPASLDVLVKEKFLDSVPADPMDNQPLRYRRTEDGIIVYSIGLDLIDGQGHIERWRRAAPQMDIGFQLWDPSKRRQPPLPLPAKEDR